MQTLSLASLFLMGVAYGATACTLSCSPMLMPLLASHGDSMRVSLRLVAIFGAGRIAAYTLIAAVASVASASLTTLLRDSDLSTALTGGVMIVTALYLFYRQRPNAPKGCAAGRLDLSRFGELGTFAMGALLSLNLCAPLLALVAVASASGSPLLAAGYGLMFGLGSVLVASLFFGLFLAPIAKELLRQFAAHKRWIEAFASALLLLAGLLVMTGRLRL
ncbi:MAG: sulfite exporter TauE/SafE family protein [Epsilonproteobacteria bacterium]|nr:sulfite exporter TauE/SafE family protein [Campylobacterota bacterium]